MNGRNTSKRKILFFFLSAVWLNWNMIPKQHLIDLPTWIIEAAFINVFSFGVFVLFLLMVDTENCFLQDAAL